MTAARLAALIGTLGSLAGAAVLLWMAGRWLASL